MTPLHTIATELARPPDVYGDSLAALRWGIARRGAAADEAQRVGDRTGGAGG
jgi:hypothetical protein